MVHFRELPYVMGGTGEICGVGGGLEAQAGFLCRSPEAEFLFLREICLFS